jgi:hypothetical protein
MAYEGGGLIQFLKPDLSTRQGAQSAMDSAKFGFLLVAGFRAIVYGLAALGGGLSFDTAGASEMPAWLVAALVLIDIALPLVAAWRLHIYKGAFVVPVVTALYVFGIVLAPSIGSVVIGAVFTAIFIGGIRGAWALRRGTGFEDDLNTTFV